MKSFLAPLATVLLAACGLPYPPPATVGDRLPPTSPAAAVPVPPSLQTATQPVTILISIDGFRPDYLHRGLTPNLGALAAGGVSGDMRPAFPSKTFPNHWTLVTGLSPDRHGIVANRMEDPALPGETFTMATVDPRWWNAAEPIWVAAERAGIRTGSVGWPGSAVAWGGVQSLRFDNKVAGGVRPHDWQAYGEGAPAAMRVRAVLDWLSRPPAERPGFAALYFDATDVAGHHYGPVSPEVDAAIAETDRAIGQLVAGLAALRLPANLVIVSDHGMAATGPSRTVPLDDFLRAEDGRALEVGPIATIYPAAGREAAVAAALAKASAHVRCWTRAAIPARFKLGRNPRVSPFLCLADDGWVIVRNPGDTATVNVGNHGFDNGAADMRALFIANGPAFRAGKRIATFDNVDVYPLLRDLLGMPPASGIDGSDRPFRKVLKGVH